MSTTWFACVWSGLENEQWLVELEAPSVFAWFRSVLEHRSYPPERVVDVAYGLAVTFDKIYDAGAAIPADDRALAVLLGEQIYAEGGFVVEPHFVSVLTDDDEGTEIEYFLFDSEFLDDPASCDRLPGFVQLELDL